MSEPIIQLDSLSKTYKNGRGVHNISLEVRRGEVYGFFGPNGAGKTTVMKMLVGLSQADTGSARLFGYDVITHFTQAMQKTGVLIETAEAFEYMSGSANLALAARFYPELGKGRIDEVLELVGLLPYKQEKVAGYSLGMKQRLGLAAALLSKPELLILDEPTNGLDIEGMVDMRELMVSLAREQGMTFFISSHMIQEMELMCSRIGIIVEGRLVREGALNELVDGVHVASLEQLFMASVKQERGKAAHVHV
ncbi:ABC transporter ATP-binding protein [Paenibacillus agricola]|uniref:ABC transporter ATP-binding protein n=1 Tax=Paenibacillus agricola TaxID=2716264 RepID=A0ABX0JA65_9BACL|nr:ABC transporter ATP-binding protein [Paenibacillus agricola]NHN30866.1 ABC transporter ATP-binding protein [Paenibacillus agricola]